ncbi:iron-containing alcohol dehydrogenase [Devosia sp. BSSL-BM10]|uniref:Iron-containing alcohol dehydrogenase n=1 Tax=Devosia litorisediminis TaxID=2829817 RepID=A0A942E2M4_9HYPH|nr:iron-containing alcohol dehydrogenase [Devosia litorisediminis]MBS3847098.1 iron-containing alcohol dehydrogenase [Devosia litorisediminis]
MSLFALQRAPRTIVFGSGQRASLAMHARALGQKALIVTDERMGGSAALGELVDALKTAGVAVAVFDRTLPEVPLDCIDQCVAFGQSFGPDLVIGLGGGSCLDMAKVTAVLLAHGGSPRDYFGEFKVPGPVLPLIAVPTTAGTGSEATPVAVVADSERLLKVGIASPHIIPLVAICDPELTLSAPAGLTAIAGADALTHAIEALTAGPRSVDAGTSHEHVFVGKNALSDGHAREAIGYLALGLRRSVENCQDLAARESVMYGALLAGLAFGTAGTSAAHAIQYPVGALTKTAHGAGVACLLPYAMTFNLGHATASMAEVAVAMGVAEAGDDDRGNAERAIVAVETLFGAIGIPANLAALGLAQDQLDWTAEQSLGAARLVKNNPRPLDLPAMQAIINAAFSGDRHRLAN